MTGRSSETLSASEAAARPSGTILGIDFGLRRTGIAVGETSVGLAHPLETIATGDDHVRLGHVMRLVEEWRPVLIVVGLPQGRDGMAHPLADTIRAWAETVRAATRVPVSFVDESLSSHAASVALAEGGVRGMRQKRFLDSVAAQQILQSFLDGQNAIA